jgi:hypothetical protein
VYARELKKQCEKAVKQAFEIGGCCITKELVANAKAGLYRDEE